MSSLRFQSASRLLQPLKPQRTLVTPILTRFSSYSSSDRTYKDRSVQPSPKADPSDPPAQRGGDSAMIRQEDSKEALVEHQPDFRAPVDHGTS